MKPQSAQTVHAGHRDLSPRQVAEAIGVSESSLKRWCDSGQIPTRRTAGGHRRIPLAGLVEFLRRKGFSPKRPDLLGLPAGAHRDGRALEALAPSFEAALQSGKEEEVAKVVIGLYLGGRSAVELCDQLLAPTFRHIGDGWEDGHLEIYQERRAIELATRALLDLERLSEPPPENAPVALSASLSGDPYTLAISMCQVVLRHQGWNATNIGPNHPVATLRKAIADTAPRLLCISISTIDGIDVIRDEVAELYQAAREAGTALAVGGRALNTEVRGHLRYSASCDNMAELAGFADSLWQRP